MLQAWIVSPRESLYFAAEATPCSLATLRRHIRRMGRHLREPLRLSLSFGVPAVGGAVIGASAFLQLLASEGVDVTLSDAIESGGTLRPPGVGSRRRPSRGGVLGRAWGSLERATNHSTGRSSG